MFVYLFQCFKMASTLEDCTIEEHQDVIRFVFSEGTKSSVIYSIMLNKYKKSFMNRAKLYKWIDGYRLGRINVRDFAASGRQWKCQMQ